MAGFATSGGGLSDRYVRTNRRDNPLCYLCSRMPRSAVGTRTSVLASSVCVVPTPGGRQTVEDGSPSPLRSGRRSIELCEGQQMAWRVVRNRRYLDAVAAVDVQ